MSDTSADAFSRVPFRQPRATDRPQCAAALSFLHRADRDQERPARRHAEIEVLGHDSLVGQLHGEAVYLRTPAVLESQGGQRTNLVIDVEQAGEALEHGTVVREDVVGVSGERQRVVHLSERGGSLLDVAEGDRAGERGAWMIRGRR
jgi:hypothetical protein